MYLSYYQASNSQGLKPPRKLTQFATVTPYGSDGNNRREVIQENAQFPSFLSNRAQTDQRLTIEMTSSLT